MRAKESREAIYNTRLLDEFCLCRKKFSAERINGKYLQDIYLRRFMMMAAIISIPFSRHMAKNTDK